jgi:hypothetical protein
MQTRPMQFLDMLTRDCVYFRFQSIRLKVCSWLWGSQFFVPSKFITIKLILCSANILPMQMRPMQSVLILLTRDCVCFKFHLFHDDDILGILKD